MCLSRPVCPSQTEKDLGEQRIIGYSGVAISVGEEIRHADIVAGVADKKEVWQTGPTDFWF